MKWTLLALATIMVVSISFFIGRLSAPELVSPGELRSLASFQRALQERDELTSNYYFSAYLQGLARSNISETLAAIESSGRQLTRWELEQLMLAWSRFDPSAAFERALFAADRAGRRDVGAAIYAWAVRDPVAARGALLGLKGDKLEEYLQGKLVAGWVRGGGLDDATEYVAGLRPGLVRQFLTRVLTDELGERSTAAVIEWSEAVPVDSNEGFKSTVFSKATSTLVRIDPAATADWLGRHIDEDYADGCTWLLAWNWIGSDPRAAFEWLSSLPPSIRRAEAIRKAFAYWYESDPRVAKAWLKANSPSASLDPAIHLVVKRTVDASPTSAIEWAKRIVDKGARERILVQIGKHWMRDDPDAAARWLDSSGLPPTARRAILSSSS